MGGGGRLGGGYQYPGKPPQVRGNLQPGFRIGPYLQPHPHSLNCFCVKNLLLAAPLALTVFAGPALAQTAPAPAAPYRLLNTIAIGGSGGWDYLKVDPAGTRLYVSHSTQVEVIDLKTRKLIGTIPNTPGVHGIEVVPSANRGYITCGRTNQCVELGVACQVAGIPAPGHVIGRKVRGLAKSGELAAGVHRGERGMESVGRASYSFTTRCV